LYVGDNGTPTDITSLFNGITIQGGKSQCTTYGTHVPLIVYQTGRASYVDSSLVDLTDFMPTLASIAKISLPLTFGTLDGTSFYPKTSTRQWTYYHYNPHPDKDSNDLVIWAQNSNYKKYDTTVAYWNLPKRNKFFNICLDANEQYPILPKYETTTEKAIDSSLTSIIRFYALQQ